MKSDANNNLNAVNNHTEEDLFQKWTTHRWQSKTEKSNIAKSISIQLDTEMHAVGKVMEVNFEVVVLPLTKPKIQDPSNCKAQIKKAQLQGSIEIEDRIGQ